MAKPLKAAGFLLETFGPLLVFYAFEHAVSLFAAIVASIVVGAALVVRQIARDKKVSPFTAFIAASVIVFGVLDLTYRSAFFLKLEPVLGNLSTAAFFLFSVALGRPILVEIAEKQVGAEKVTKARGYLRAWTLAWGGFFVVRAAAYLWMAFHMTLDQTLVIRGTIMPLSFVVMIVGEMGVRHLRFGKKAFGKPAPVAAPQT